MAAIGLYLEKISYLSTSEVIEQKKGIFRNVNGDAFLPMKMCPLEMRLLFLKKTYWVPTEIQAVAFLRWKRLLSWSDFSVGSPNHGNLKPKASTPSILCN